MAEDTEDTKKRGFFSKLMRLAFIAAIGIASDVRPETIQVTATAQNRTKPQPVTLRPRSEASIAAAIIVPMLVSSLGRAWLAWCAGEERDVTLSLLQGRTDAVGEMARDAAYVKRILRETRRRGYALNKGEWLAEASVTAIAFPVRIGEHAIAAINLVLQRSAISDREVVTRYVPMLRNLADEISKGVAALPRG